MAREFYPGWADEAGRAMVGQEPKQRTTINPRPTRSNRVADEMKRAQHRAVINGQFEMCHVSLDVALRETSR